MTGSTSLPQCRPYRPGKTWTPNAMLQAGYPGTQVGRAGHEGVFLPDLHGILRGLVLGGSASQQVSTT